MAFDGCTTNTSLLDPLQSSDKLYVFSTTSGLQMLATVGTLQTYMQDSLTFGVADYITQYSSPSSTGFSVQINDDTKDNHLILTPTATFATGTIILPANPADKQLVLVNCTQIVTTLTVDGGVNTVTGEPSSLAANDFFTLKYDTPTKVWYRIS
jgi:hypothetical protein